MLKKLWVVALFAGFVMLPCAAMAAQGAAPAASSSSGEDKMAAEEKKVEGELGVSPEQHQKMQTSRQEFQAKQRALNEELQAKKTELRDALEGDNAPDRGKVDGLVADIKALQGKMLDNRVEQVFKLREILTPDQYKKLKELRKQRQAESAEAKGKGKGKPMEKQGNKKK